MKINLPILVLFVLTLVTKSWSMVQKEFPTHIYESSEIPNDFFLLKKSSMGDLFITNIEFKLRGRTAHYVITKINPSGSETSLGKMLFNGNERPRTWTDAVKTCDSLNLAESKWHLPTHSEATEINLTLIRGYLLNFSAGKTIEVPDLVKSWVRPDKLASSQFDFFWTNSSNLPDKQGVMLTYNMAKDQSVHQTVQKPLNFFCLSYFYQKENKLTKG